jgi:hypothetical protein
MAPRTRKIRHDDETRLKIQVSQLLNRLQKHVLGEVEMSPTQIQAAQILLKKALPDLQAIDLKGAGEGGAIPLIVTGVRRAGD